MSIPDSILCNPELRASAEAAIERANVATSSIQPGLLEAPSADIRLLRALPDDLLGEVSVVQVDTSPQPHEVVEVEPEEVVNGAVSAAKWAMEQVKGLQHSRLDAVEKAKVDSHTAALALALHLRR